MTVEKVMEIERRMDFRRQIKDADWDAQYQARMRILNMQRKIGANGQVILKRRKVEVMYAR
jgi:hypothetical protein